MGQQYYLYDREILPHHWDFHILPILYQYWLEIFPHFIASISSAKSIFNEYWYFIGCRSMNTKLGPNPMLVYYWGMVHYFLCLLLAHVPI